MVAYVQWRDSLCKECGVIADLGFDPTTTFSVTDERCWGCKVREDRQDEIEKQAKKNPAVNNGVKVWISKARPTRNLKVVDDG